MSALLFTSHESVMCVLVGVNMALSICMLFRRSLSREFVEGSKRRYFTVGPLTGSGTLTICRFEHVALSEHKQESK